MLSRAEKNTRSHPLDVLMTPRSVVVLGASPREGALGNTVVKNLLELGFKGEIYPVHPKAPEVCGLKALPAISLIPDKADCAVVCLSADKVLPALEEAARHGVGAAVIFASGFAETGEAGGKLQDALARLARRTGMKICGPNCLGLANFDREITLYSATLATPLAKGDVAVLSHSGSGCIALSSTGRFGLSQLVSIGNGAVVDVHDYLDYLAEDDATRVAAIFLESIRNPQAFATAARKMRQAGKWVVALKVGRSAKGAAATAAHTGSLAGKAAICDDFLARCGVISVEDIDELVETVELVRALRSKPQGKGVAVITVSGGEIALTCDVAQRVGLDLPQLSEQTKAKLAEVLPAFAHPGNPVDVTGVGVFDMAMYRACIEALDGDPAISVIAVGQDCPLGLGAKQAATYEAIARTVAETSASLAKPVVFYSNISGGVHPLVAAPLFAAGVPVLQGTRASLVALKRLLDLRADVAAGEKPASVAERSASWHERLASGGALTEREAKLFFRDAGLPVTREELAKSAEEAQRIAEALSYPVVMKIESPDIQHKSDVGGVMLGLKTPEEVAEAYRAILKSVASLAPEARVDGVLVQEMASPGVDVIVGVTREEPFGPAIVVGAGGVLVELIADSAVALAPLSPGEARDLISRTKVSRILDGYRGGARADLDALADLVARVSQLAAAYGDVIEAIDLNPVRVGPERQGVAILDALIVPRAEIPTRAKGETA